MVKKYISQSGVTIEIGDFYGGGPDEHVVSLEEKEKQLYISTNLDIHIIDLRAGDYLGMQDGSGKLVKPKESI
jgi:hypothetical protein